MSSGKTLSGECTTGDAMAYFTKTGIVVEHLSWGRLVVLGKSPWQIYGGAKEEHTFDHLQHLKNGVILTRPIL